MFDPGKPNLLSLIFASMASTLESLGRTVPSLANIRPGWKGLPGTNTLAYFARSKVTKKIKCCKICPRSLQILKMVLFFYKAEIGKLIVD